MSTRTPELKAYNFNAAAYDLIVMGVPVWAWRPAPPINTFLVQNDISNKKTALFICHGGGIKGVMELFRDSLPKNEIIGEIDFLNALKNKDVVIKQIEEWTKIIKEKMQPK